MITQLSKVKQYLMFENHLSAGERPKVEKPEIKNSSRGFTLIELMVVTLIMVTLAGVMTYNFGEARKQQVISSAGRELVSNLRAVQGYVLAGSDVGSGQVPRAYEVRFVNSATEYSAYYCLDYSFGACSEWTLLGTERLPERVSFQSTLNVRFESPRGKLLVDGASLAVGEIVMVHSSGDRATTVTVDGISGRITISQ